MTLSEDSDNTEYSDLKKHGGFLDSIDISIDGQHTSLFFTSWCFHRKYISFVELVTIIRVNASLFLTPPIYELYKCPPLRSLKLDKCSGHFLDQLWYLLWQQTVQFPASGGLSWWDKISFLSFLPHCERPLLAGKQSHGSCNFRQINFKDFSRIFQGKNYSFQGLRFIQ